MFWIIPILCTLCYLSFQSQHIITFSPTNLVGCPIYDYNNIVQVPSWLVVMKLTQVCLCPPAQVHLCPPAQVCLCFLAPVHLCQSEQFSLKGPAVVDVPKIVLNSSEGNLINCTISFPLSFLGWNIYKSNCNTNKNTKFFIPLKCVCA